MNYIICKTNAITSLSRPYLPYSASPKFLQVSPSGAIFICYLATPLTAPQARSIFGNPTRSLEEYARFPTAQNRCVSHEVDCMYINYEDLQCEYIITSTHQFFVHPSCKLRPNKNAGLSMNTKPSLLPNT